MCLALRPAGDDDIVLARGNWLAVGAALSQWQFTNWPGSGAAHLMQALLRLQTVALAGILPPTLQFVRAIHSMRNRSSAKKRYVMIADNHRAKKHPWHAAGKTTYLNHYADVKRLRQLLPNSTKKHT